MGIYVGWIEVDGWCMPFHCLSGEEAVGAESVVWISDFAWGGVMGYV